VLVQTRAHAFEAGRCAQSLMLAAWNDGIGSCPGHLPEAAVATLLGPPSDLSVHRAIGFGYVDAERDGPATSVARRRRPSTGLVHWNPMVSPICLVLVAALLLAGCASGQACQGRTGGWLSGWGNTRGGNTVTVGLHRAWWDCQDRTLTPSAPQAPLPLPAPSADPVPDVRGGPSAPASSR
jgi:hypothetical protein